MCHRQDSLFLFKGAKFYYYRAILLLFKLIGSIITEKCVPILPPPKIVSLKVVNTENKYGEVQEKTEFGNGLKNKH